MEKTFRVSLFVDGEASAVAKYSGCKNVSFRSDGNGIIITRKDGTDIWTSMKFICEEE